MINSFYNQPQSVPVRLAHYVMLLILSLLSHGVYAQSYEGLNELKGNKTQTYFSACAEVKAARMAKQLDRVMLFYNQYLNFTPSVTLLVLSPDDWSKYTTFPVYGMPHYTS